MISKKEFLNCVAENKVVRFECVTTGEDIKVRLCCSASLSFACGQFDNPTMTIKVKEVNSGEDVKLSGLGKGELSNPGSVVGRLYKKDNQITGNIGLYYVCYLLSRGERRWNVMPTARNARGIDVLAYPEEDQGNKRPLMIQVKTLSEKSPVPLGKDLRNIVGDFWIIVVLGKEEKDTSVYMMEPEKIRQCFGDTKREQYWLSYKEYKEYEVNKRHEIGVKLLEWYNENVREMEERMPNPTFHVRPSVELFSSR